MPQPEQLGFIGLGIMGFPMAENLLKEGYPLTVFNRTRGKAEQLTSRGAVVASSPAEVARQARVIFICVGGSADVCEVVDDMLPLVAPGSLVADCSTISPKVSREIAARFRERGADFLDAPCTGSKAGATSAALTFMVGGDRKSTRLNSSHIQKSRMPSSA